jgi:rare lipoprotein A
MIPGMIRGMMRALALLLGAALSLAACHRQPATTAALHYQLGENYQSDGVWHYPREQFTLDETGLAEVMANHGPLTADGELFDQTALAAAHPTLQLPALARITDIATGRQILVRVNDRGPAASTRLIAITRRAAELLGSAGQAAIPVRFEVLDSESRAMADALRSEAPKLNIATVADGPVRSETLAPPPGIVQSTRGRVAPPGPSPIVVRPAAATAEVPLRLPETVTQVAPRPVTLMIECGSFSSARYADLMRNQLASLGAVTTTSYTAPRDRAYVVQIGPLPDVASADATLARARRAGATDARIIVD